MALYRGIRLSDKKHIFLKKIITEPPDLEDLKHLQEEYLLLTKLPSADVPKPLEFIDNGKQAGYAIEDEGFIFLSHYLINQSLSLKQFLRLAISLTNIISDLHQRGIIHKDIKPENILINPKNCAVKLINFDTVIAFPWFIYKPNALRETLAYISPEQTGRMNRTVDYRTDYYSLGITLYEMLTGKLPFQANDAIGMVHAHIAKLPEAPEKINANVPAVISNIILKLLAKIPEERYQSTFGLKDDLQNCLTQYEHNDTIAKFDLAKQDVSKHFIVSQRLYGRDSELELLHKTFAEVKNGKSCLIMVSGEAGIGKSALLNELYKEVVASHGYYCVSKFDQYQSNVPYSAFIVILKTLVKQILTENEAKLAQWQEKIKAAVGNNIGLLTNILPELELVVGKQEVTPTTDATNSEVLFYRVIKDFMQLFATKDHPLVLFFDDMQWTNYSSLRFLDYLIRSDSQYILILGAYRIEDLKAGHPLLHTLKDIKNAKFPINEINLTSLSQSDVSQLVADTLFTDQQSVMDLSKLCYEKTLGNPFFLNHLLNLIYEEGFIQFNNQRGKWCWDINQIKQIPVTANVIDLMIHKLEKFPEITRNLLQYAACIGNTFSLHLLAQISNLSKDDMATALWPALDEGYILPYSSDAQFGNEIRVGHIFKFLHDKVQQAAYQIIPVADKQIIHKKIGKILLQDISEKKLAKKIFLIVNHFNYAIDLIEDEQDKIELAQLNHMAAERAQNAIAFGQADQYIKVALSLLPETAWTNYYELSLKIHTTAAYLAYFLNDHRRMAQLSNMIFAKARTTLDKMPIYELQIDANIKLNKCRKTLNITREALSQLGTNLPIRFIKFHLLLAIIKLKFVSRFKSKKSIINAEPLANPEKQMAIRLFIKCLPAAQSISPNIFALVSLKTVLLSIKYRSQQNVAAAFVTCALIFFRIGDLRNTYKFLEIALQLAAKSNCPTERAPALVSSAAFLQPWLIPLRATLPTLADAYKIAYDSGQINFMSYGAFFYSVYCFWAGVELSKVISEGQHFLSAVKPFQQDITLTSFNHLFQLIENLQGGTSKPTLLNGTYLDEKVWLASQKKIKNNLEIAAFHMIKMYINYLFGNYKAAGHHADQIKIDLLSGSFAYADVIFYISLTRLATLPHANQNLQQKFLKQIHSNQKILKKLAKTAAVNVLNKYYLVAAELAVFNRNFNKAAKYYDQAIELAHEHQFLQEEALANELAGKFYLTYKNKIASAYLRDAYYNYQKWGAFAKLKQLTRNYENLLSDVAVHEKSKPPLALDLTTILKASRVISGEMSFAKLIKKTLKILVENMGADRCVLLLSKNNELYIEGEYHSKGSFLNILNSVPYRQSKSIPTSVIDYVKRTRQTVKIDDITNDQVFINDAYLQTHQPKSILCTPLLQQGELQGVFYFENRLAINAFSNDRLQLLNSLSGQIAISVENSRLYESFKRFVPQEFLNLIQKSHVVDVQLGDYMQKNISVMFMDIAGFTALSEKLLPQEIFQFINDYLSYMEPIIASNHGFIDKYIGDGIMALFPDHPEDAIDAAIALQAAIKAYNQNNKIFANFKLQARIGINTGPSILGTIGSKHRIDGSVIGDAVNTASRITDLNQMYGAQILISEHTLQGLKNSDQYCMRMIDKVCVKGKTEIIKIWQILTDIPLDKQKHLTTLFADAWLQYSKGLFLEAKHIFQQCLQDYPDDEVAVYFIRKCDELLESGVPKHWNGVTILTTKLHF